LNLSASIYKSIPNSIIRRIEKTTFSWDRFFDLAGEQIGELINFSKQGKNIHKSVHRVPRLELKGHVQTITRTVIKLELKISVDFRFDESNCFFCVLKNEGKILCQGQQ
jgi:pre-mRNA-splicing helicase BRR2